MVHKTKTVGFGHFHNLKIIGSAHLRLQVKYNRTKSDPPFFFSRWKNNTSIVLKCMDLQNRRQYFFGTFIYFEIRKGTAKHASYDPEFFFWKPLCLVLSS